MQAHTGTIQSIQRDAYGDRAARIISQGRHDPTPGRYTLAVHPGQPAEVLGQPLYPVGLADPLHHPDNHLLGPIPPSWSPGDDLLLHPPSGRGFHLPPEVRRLALAAFGSTPARLLPLLQPALQAGADIVLFTHTPALDTNLPVDVEIQSLRNLPQALPWAAFLAIDIPLGELAGLRTAMNLSPHERLPCPAQALVWTAMPCSAIGNCGACAVPTRRNRYELACQAGPVFDLHALRW